MEKSYDQNLSVVKQLSMLKNACSKLDKLGLNIKPRKTGFKIYDKKTLIGELAYDGDEEAYVGHISPSFHTYENTISKRNLKQILLEEGFAIHGAVNV